MGNLSELPKCNLSDKDRPEMAEGSVEGQHAKYIGNATRRRQIIDARIASAPSRHNSHEEGERIKASKNPKVWKQKPANTGQKDKMRVQRRHASAPVTVIRATSALTASLGSHAVMW